MSRLVLRWTLLSLALLSLPAAARGDDDDAPVAVAPPPKITEKDFATMRAIEYAKTLKSERIFRSGRNAETMASAEQALAKTIRETGWSTEKLDDVTSALRSVVEALDRLDAGGEEAADARETLKGFDPVTVATAKSHRAEVVKNDDQARAEKEVREGQKAEAAGEVPTVASLQGVWELSVDATVEAMANGNAELGAKLREAMAGKLGKSTYRFGPGNAIEATSVQPGKAPEVTKGTFRLDGHALYTLPAGGKRESKLELGLKGGRLLVGLGFMSTVFVRKP